MSESLADVDLAPGLAANDDVLVTRRGNTVYVHLNREPISDTVKLKPIRIAPRIATLLNTGQPVRCCVDVPPSEWTDNQRFLRLRDLPIASLAKEVPIVKLEFDEPPTSMVNSGPPSQDGDIRVR